jgi:competence protein ComEC
MWIRVSMISTIALCLSLSINILSSMFQEKLIVYNVNKSTAIDFIDGNNHVLLADSSVLENKKTITMSFRNNWTDRRLRDAIEVPMNRVGQINDSIGESCIMLNKSFIFFNGKRIAIVNKNNSRVRSAKPIMLDYLIISGNAKVQLDDLIKSYKPGMIIIDSSNSEWRTEKWEKECAKLKIPYYSVKDSGALIISI